MTQVNYAALDTTELIKLSIDFVKVGQPLPEEIRTRLDEWNLLHIICPRSIEDEDIEEEYE